MSQPWEDLLPIPRVLQLYREAMSFGGLPSDPTPGCLEQCLGNAWTAESYLQEGGIPLGLIFATRLFWYLLHDHCFVDGNKRISWYCLVYVLIQYNLTIDVIDEEAEEMTLRAAKRDISPEEVTTWVADRLVEI